MNPLIHPSQTEVTMVPSGKNNKTGKTDFTYLNESFTQNHDGEDCAWNLEEFTERTTTTCGNVTLDQIKSVLRQGCTLRAWKRKIPILIWLPKYSLQDFKGDLVAGLTVGLTVVPQGLAYAAIATVPLEYGLYSAFMGCFMYTLFGTAKDVTLGPTAVLSLMTAAVTRGHSDSDRANLAVLLSFYTGVTQVLLALFNLGFLLNFISAPVISGFTTASAFIILYGQIKTLTGITLPQNTNTVIEYTYGYFSSFSTINGWDTLLGVICFTILLLMKELKLPRKPKWNIPKKHWSILKELVRTICVTRYALIIIVATGIGYGVSISGKALSATNLNGLSLTSTVKGGIPKFGPPQLSWGNHTVQQTFLLIAPHLPMVVLVGALESLAVAKAFAFEFQYRIVPSQELFALGLSNILCSFFHGYPVTGSFTRSALKAQSGVRTPMGCTWTGAFVLLALAVISPAFKFVPKPALSAVIMAAILILFEFKIFKDLWQINKRELFPILLTIVVAFTVSVDIGILAGVGASLLLLLWPLARPTILAYFKDSLFTFKPRSFTKGKRVIHIDVTPQGALFFPGAEYLVDFFQDEVINPEHTDQEVHTKSLGPDGHPVKLQITEIKEQVVFNGTHLTDSDYTSLRALHSIVIACEKANKPITFINTDPMVLKIILPKKMRAKIKTEAPVLKMDISTVQLSQSTAERMAAYSKDVINEMELTDSTKSTGSKEILESPNDEFSEDTYFKKETPNSVAVFHL